MTHDAETKALIKRLMLLPALMELDNQTQVAAAIGVGYKNWNHTLNTGDLSFNTAKAIVRAIPGLDLDWVTWGVEDGLTTRIRNRLIDLQAPPDHPNSSQQIRRRSPK
jgi:hypothetical protein